METRILMMVLPMILREASPTCKNELNNFITGLRKKAAETKNPADDILAEILFELVKQ